MTERILWGIHAGRTGEAEGLFIQKKVIALGWVEFGTFEGLRTRDDFKHKYAQVYSDVSGQSIATSAGQLYRFVYEVKNGDIVVFPAKGDRHVHLGEISGEYAYRPEIDKRYPNQRAVKWLTQVPRTRFSQGALYEMGSAMALFQIRNYADEIIAALEGAPAPVALIDQTVSLVAEDIEEQTRDFVLKQLESSLKGTPLEYFIQHLLMKMGYQARLARINEPSVDLIAHKDELGFEPPIIKVQVKSSPGKITDKDVSALSGKLSNQENGLMITLGEFTRDAWQFAMSKSNLRLIDGAELVDLILEHYEDFDPRYKGIIPLKKVYIPQALEGQEA